MTSEQAGATILFLIIMTHTFDFLFAHSRAEKQYKKDIEDFIKRRDRARDEN